MKVNLVIPCYNEEESIKKLFASLVTFSNEIDINFYILNNGSTDGTLDIMKTLNERENIKFISLKENKGYGYGVNYGLNYIKDADYIGWFHGDLQFDIRNLENIYEIINSEFINENKQIFFKGIRTGRNFISQLFSYFMGLFATLLLRKHFYEINAQPTIFSSALYDSLTDYPYDFSYDTYVYWVAKKNRYKFLRKKVTFPNRPYGTSKWDFGIYSKIQFSYKNLKYLSSLIQH